MQPLSEPTPFVDLYELLTLPVESDAATVRKRIMSVYLEAQNNLDHRNFRKRFYYQELFETYLPQAHHLLLNETRRAAYDEELHAYRARKQQGDVDTELEFVKAPPEVKQEVASLASAPVAHEKNATAQAQNDIQSNSNAANGARPQPRAAPPQDVRAQAAKPQGAPQIVTRLEVPASMRMDLSAVERRRDHKRRALIQRELEGIGLFWGLVSGVMAALFLGLALHIVLDKLPGGTEQPFGFPWRFFTVLCFVAMLAFSVFSARIALRYTRKRVVSTLSKMPYEQLLRRCGRG